MGCKSRNTACFLFPGIAGLFFLKYRAERYAVFGVNNRVELHISTIFVYTLLLSDMILGRKNDCAEVFSTSRTVLRPMLAVNAAEAVISLLTPTVPRCPHMGCALKYNKAEHSWDCPCHGSRFDREGRLLDNPATADRKNRRQGSTARSKWAEGHSAEKVIIRLKKKRRAFVKSVGVASCRQTAFFRCLLKFSRFYAII